LYPTVFTVFGITTSPPGPVYPVNSPASLILNCAYPFTINRKAVKHIKLIFLISLKIRMENGETEKELRIEN
jgi:hypothetical protein